MTKAKFNKKAEKTQKPSQQDIDQFVTAAAYNNAVPVKAFLKKFGNKHVDAEGNASSHGYGTAMGFAAAFGNDDVVEVLLKAGASLSKKQDGNTPQQWAVANEHEETASLIRQEARRRKTQAKSAPKA